MIAVKSTPGPTVPVKLPPQIEVLTWETYLSRWQWHALPASEFHHSSSVDSSSCVDQAPELADIPPAGPAPTRPIVRNAVSARATAADIARTFLPGQGSLYFAKWPGVGGTTAFARAAAENLAARTPGWVVGLAVVALPRRALVMEKASATTAYAKSQGLSTQVLTLLGKSTDQHSGWYCSAEYFEARATLHRELNRSSCVGCPARDLCDEMPGMYRHGRAQVIEAVRRAKRGEGAPILLFTTHASLPTLWSELPKRAPVVLDEAGNLFGLAQEMQISWSEIDMARENAEEYVRTEVQAGRTITGDLQRWRKCVASAPDRDAAGRRMSEGLRTASDGAHAGAIASAWGEALGLDASKIGELITRHWPDAKKLVRALLAYGASRDRLPDLLAADLVRRVLRMMQRTPYVAEAQMGSRVRGRRRKRAALEAMAKELQRHRRLLQRAVRRLPEEYRRALADGKVRPPRGANGVAAWPWEEIRLEDGEDLRPAFASTVIEVVREALAGRSPVMRRTRRVIRLWLPDTELVNRAKRGYVAWIAVGPCPSLVREALSAREERVLAVPDGLRVLVLSRLTKRGWGTFGPGMRHRKLLGRRVSCASLEDEVTSDLAKKLARDAELGALTFRGNPVHSFRAVLHQHDWQRLGQPKWARYFNAGHEGTDDFLSGQMLLVRRWMPPFSECVLVAEVLRRTLGIPPPRGAGVVDVEERRWWYGFSQGDPIPTAHLTEPLERELQRFFEMQGMLNAIGRCRPLSAGPEGRVVVLLNGRPLDWLRITDGPYDVLGPATAGLLGVRGSLPSEKRREKKRLVQEQRDAERATERQGRLLGLLKQQSELGQPRPSKRRLAAQLGTTDSTLRRDLSELGGLGEEAWVAEVREDLLGSLAGSLKELLQDLRTLRVANAVRRLPLGEVAAVRRDPHTYISMRAPLHSGHFGRIPLSESELRHLPNASEVAQELSGGPRSLSERAVRRHLADLRRGLRGDVDSLLPSRSDRRGALCEVLAACIRVLERRRLEASQATNRVITARLAAPELPFELEDAAALPLCRPPPSGCANVTDQVNLAPKSVDDPQPRELTGEEHDEFEVLEERAAIQEFDAPDARNERVVQSATRGEVGDV